MLRQNKINLNTILIYDTVLKDKSKVWGDF